MTGQKIDPTDPCLVAVDVQGEYVVLFEIESGLKGDGA